MILFIRYYILLFFNNRNNLSYYDNSKKNIGLIFKFFIFTLIFTFINKFEIFASSNSCFKLKDIDYCKSVDINNIKNKFELYCIEYNTKDARKSNNSVSNGNSTISSEGRDCTILFPLEVKDIDFGERSILDGIDCSKSENKNNSECLIFCLNFPENKECQEVCKNNPNDTTLQHCMIEKCKSNPTAEGCSVCEAINQDKGNANNTGEYNQEENRNATWPRSPENTMDVKGTCLSGYTESEEGLPRRNCIVTGTEEEGNKDISWSAITGGSCVKGCRIRGDVENMDILAALNINSFKICSDSSCNTVEESSYINMIKDENGNNVNSSIDSLGYNQRLVGLSCNSGYSLVNNSDGSLNNDSSDSINNGLSSYYPVVECNASTGKLNIVSQVGSKNTSCSKVCMAELINSGINNTSENYYNLVEDSNNTDKYIVSWPTTKAGNTASIECESGYYTYDGIDITDKTVLASLSNGANLKTSITRKCNEDGTWEGSGLSSTLTTEEQKNKDINDYKNNKLYTKGCFKPGYNVYNFTGSVQTFNVPRFVPMVEAEIWGAEGSKDANYGGYTSGKLITVGKYNGSDLITKINAFYIYVGGYGNRFTNTGWNGGGLGAKNIDFSNTRSGGGATDIRISSSSSLTCNINTDPRILVAGGGGSNTSKSGVGGGLAGGDSVHMVNDCASSSYKASTGGTQSSGGIATNCYMGTTYTKATDGSCGNGGIGMCGGGGGWYGGAGGNMNADAAGGSGYYDTNKGYVINGSTSTQTTYEGDGLAILWYGRSKPTGIACGDISSLTSSISGVGSWTKTNLNSGETSTGTCKSGYEGSVTISCNNGGISTKGSCIASGCKEFKYTGGVQTFSVPSGVEGMKIQLWGAGGGLTNGTQAPGGYAYGEFFNESYNTLYVYVGQRGQNGNAFNGGGTGTNGSNVSGSTDLGGGGGATDIRVSSSTALNCNVSGTDPRILVAGGGGGSRTGGEGGGISGNDSLNNTISGGITAKGGTATAGGKGSYNGSVWANSGSCGKGGNGGNTGGGGGWYGGGAGYQSRQDGAGGSGYINSDKYSITGSMESGKKTGDGFARICWGVNTACNGGSSASTSNSLCN